MNNNLSKIQQAEAAQKFFGFCTWFAEVEYDKILVEIIRLLNEAEKNAEDPKEKKRIHQVSYSCFQTIALFDCIDSALRQGHLGAFINEHTDN